MTVLERMPPERFEEFASVSSASHAADSVASGRWLAHESKQLARAELARLLPQGAATPDQSFYEIKCASEGPLIGFIWFASMPRGTVRVAFVFQLFIYPEYRRQGHARAALAQIENLADGMGLGGVALNVAGSNSAARTLYFSLGYEVTSLSLHKPISHVRVV